MNWIYLQKPRFILKTNSKGQFFNERNRMRSIAEYQLCKCKIHVTKQQQNLVRVYIKLKGYTVNELE